MILMFLISLASLFAPLTAASPGIPFRDVAIVASFSTRSDGDDAAAYVAHRYPRFQGWTPGDESSSDEEVSDRHIRVFVVRQAPEKQDYLNETIKGVATYATGLVVVSGPEYGYLSQNEIRLLPLEYQLLLIEGDCKEIAAGNPGIPEAPPLENIRIETMMPACTA